MRPGKVCGGWGLARGALPLVELSLFFFFLVELLSQEFYVRPGKVCTPP